MTVENGIEIARIILDFLKTLIPFGALFLIFLVFKDEIKTVIKNGGFKVLAPGFSLETLQKQQEKVGKTEKKEIGALNKELKTSQQREQKLKELQEYTSRDKDTYFLGYHFEKTYRLIFPSQMVILNVMNNSSNKAIIDVLAQAIFRRTIWATEFNISYEQFMAFLIESGLVNYDQLNQKFLLTPLGSTFWEYLKGNNIHLKMPAADMIFPANPEPAQTIVENKV